VAISYYTHPLLPKKKEHKTCLKHNKAVTFWQEISRFIGFFALKEYKKGIFWAVFGGGGIRFRTISAHLRKKGMFGDRFRTIPAQF